MTRPTPAKPHERIQAAEPTTVVADVGDAGEPGERCRHVVDRGAGRPHLRFQPDLERRRKRIGVEPLDRAARSGKSAEPRGGLFLRHEFTVEASPLFAIISLTTRCCSGVASSAVDRELGRFAPAPDDALKVGVDHQEEAEHEESGGDRQHREQRGAPVAPQALCRFGEEVLQRAHSGHLHDAAVVERDGPAADAADQLAVVGRDERPSCRAR